MRSTTPRIASVFVFCRLVIETERDEQEDNTGGTFVDTSHKLDDAGERRVNR